MNWIFITLQWYLYILILGIIFFPLTAKIFSNFADRGYAFSKTLAILFLSYAVFVLGILKILPFTQNSIFLLIIIFIIATILFIWKNKLTIKPLAISHFTLFIIEELIFLAGLFFLTFIRGQEPSIHGLEKFMDYGFMKSILRSEFFPPLDIWLSREPINYYYFGHLTGAFLIKLIGINSAIGYNLILATILAQSASIVFSLVGNIVYLFQKIVLKIEQINLGQFILFGLLGSFIVNFGGNLHTIYAFTSGYPNDNPIPFWQILSSYDPTKYWYPNATRFIPFTIHEFPAYSYVVADLHGHVFDIPFVLLTIAILFKLFISNFMSFRAQRPKEAGMTWWVIFLGFMCTIHYMTNAFDGPIYLLLTGFILLALNGLSLTFLINIGILFLSFIFFSIPFSAHFSPFVSGIGVNCSLDFLVNLKKIGPFLFEKGNCQISPLWMLFILWGFFWINFILFLIIQKIKSKLPATNYQLQTFNIFFFILFSFGTFLIIIPEFFYIKDIYPAHFRANTMFKLGYQAFIIMGVASAFVFYQLKFVENFIIKIILKSIFLFFFFFIFIYSFFAFPSYYGKLDRPVELDGSQWLTTSYLEDKEIIDYLNENIANQPTILEAQGDSYTDYERISSYTGLPTVAGWWVHEWLWRGSPDAVGKRIPDVGNLYESPDIELTKSLLKKYQIEYIIISNREKEKYKKLNFEKFGQIGKKIFESTNKLGAIYQVENL